MRRGACWMMCVALGGLAACGSDGARGRCGEGGALTACAGSDAASSAEAACWRMVDCGAIVVSADDDNKFDWGNCVDVLESMSADGERLARECIAASSCDALKIEGSPGNVYAGQFRCVLLGAGGR